MELCLKFKFFEIRIFINMGVTIWYQSSSLSEPLTIGGGLGLKLKLFLLLSLGKFALDLRSL